MTIYTKYSPVCRGIRIFDIFLNTFPDSNSEKVGSKFFAKICKGTRGKPEQEKIKASAATRSLSGSILSTLFFVILVCGFSVELYPQGTTIATVKGIVRDKETGELLTGATVVIKGTTLGAMTDFDGLYTFTNLPSGQVTLQCSFVSYEQAETTISLKDGQEVEVNFDLTTSMIELSEAMVVSKANRESENILMLEQKKSLLATQSIGAQELSRKGVSDAESAVTKISGISKQDGVKNVFVRGLGDRYNVTTLNGFILPSEDPEYKNISLDFFTSDIIQAITVSKVFSASMTGDVGGALIDIKSKELIGDSEFEIGVSSSLNSMTVGKDIYLAEGMNSFGYSTASYGPYDNYSTDYSFNTSLDPVKVNNPYNYGISFSGGKKFMDKHRFFVAGSVDNKYRYEEGILRQITSTDAANPFVDMLYTRYIKSSSNLLLGNLELNYTRAKLSYNALYIHSGLVYDAELYGKHTEIFQEAPGLQGLIRRQQINDNALFVNQLFVQGKISERVKYFAGASVNQLTGKEPDRRIFAFPSIGNDSIKLHHSEFRNRRFNSDLNEMAVLPKVSLQYKLSADSDNNSRIEMGYDSRISYKEFTAPVYRHIVNQPVPEFDRYNVVLDNYINQEGLSNGSFMISHTSPPDYYDVVRSMHGAYIDLVYQLGSFFTLNAGVRADDVYIKIDYVVNEGANEGSDNIDGMFFSPSLNLKYELNDKHHLRIGSSRTFTLPQDIEISPFVRDGFDGYEVGNPDLEVSTNYNLDLKWDYYISAGELLSLTGFYKHIVDPIARLDMANSAGIKTFDNIGDYACAAGLEAEFRKKLLSLANKHRFNLGVNASYIHTRHHGLDKALFTEKNLNSAMEGASPYIVNADLTYNLVSGTFSMNSALVVNYLGDKIHTIGTRGFNTLYEESVTTLDFVNTFKINNHLGIGFKAMNLLNPEFNLTRKGSDSNVPPAVIRSYKKGMSFDLSIKYKF
ncbi:MAG: TonB-dependent receptor [Bacteroidales bacterium]